jgi:hypothetical protein
MRWFEQRRQLWIADMLRVYGFINRNHIERKFRVSQQQASHDLTEFHKRNPGAMTYNMSSKRYEAGDGGE